jgi:hypothetical protein
MILPHPDASATRSNVNSSSRCLSINHIALPAAVSFIRMPPRIPSHPGRH